MRFALLMGLLLVACTGAKLAMTPPAGVDLSGKWQLNDADSDDPLRVAMSENSPAGLGGAAASTPSGRGGRGGGRNAGGGTPAGSNPGPTMPAVGTLNDGLRWPGRALEVTQTGGVVTINSLGIQQVYRPDAGALKQHGKSSSDESAHGRRLWGDERGDRPPPVCGWDDKTLVVQSENPDEENPPFEQRFSLSGDGARLIEVVAFKGGRSQGFVVSRVWDRVVLIDGAPPDPHATHP